jgi:hypothetical protein
MSTRITSYVEDTVAGHFLYFLENNGIDWANGLVWETKQPGLTTLEYIPSELETTKGICASPDRLQYWFQDYGTVVSFDVSEHAAILRIRSI